MQIKLKNTDVIWSYLGSFFQYCTSLIILPFVLSNISTGELGLWYTFASVGTLVTYLDFGFSTTLIRNITYAWSGANRIQAEGFDKNDLKDEIDIAFVKKILTAVRLINLLVAIVALLVLATAGTYYINYITRDFVGNAHIMAWYIYAFAVFLNLYYNYCGNALRGIGEIGAYQKIIVIARIVQIIISYIGIQIGYGLIALSTAYLISGYTIRLLSNIRLKKRIETVAKNQNKNMQATIKERVHDTVSIFKDIWFNAKRIGIITLCSYATNQSLTLICSAYLGVEATASYGLSLQIITSILSVGGIMFSAAQPQMINQMVTGNSNGYRKTFSMGMFAFWFVSIGGMTAFGLLSNFLLSALGSSTRIQMGMYVFICVYMLLEHNHGLFTAYFTMRNTIVFLYPYIISSILIAVLSFIVAILGGNIYVLMAIHFVVQICYNNWKWPKGAMAGMNTNIVKMVEEGFAESKTMAKKILHVRRTML